MKVEQIKDIINLANRQVLGKEELTEINLEGLISTGKTLFQMQEEAPNNHIVDNYVNAIIDATAKYVFVNRVYKRRAPKVLMDNWEFGTLVRKIRISKLPKAQNNQAWELVDGQVYEENQFYKPHVIESIFNDKTSFMVPISITEEQVKSAFTTMDEMTRFIGMIETMIYNKLNLDLDATIMLTINNMISLTLKDDYGTSAYNSKSGVKAVNLLYLYNQKYGTTLTKQKAIGDKDFLRFAVETIKNYTGKLTAMTSLFNIKKSDKFTEKDLQHLVILDTFINAIQTHLQSDTYHKELVEMPYYETVNFWQGVGNDFEFEDTSTINITDSNGNKTNINYVVGVLFDRDALGVSQFEDHVETKYIKIARFWNNFYSREARYFNALDEQFVVFFLA